MISPERFHHFLAAQGVDFFTGVPDSLMKHLLQYFHEHIDASRHIITPNEGLAVALAAGYYFSTGKLPLVYLQNSGLGNAVNPLTSITDKEMYGIPMLLMIGWRGEPGKKDEPQHKKMGRITKQLLQTLEIPFFVLQKEEAQTIKLLNSAINAAVTGRQPVALLITKDVFEAYEPASVPDRYPLARKQVLNMLFNFLTGNETVVCTTGETGREFYEMNREYGHVIKKELLSVGGMGLAGHIALGIDLQQPGRVIMLDGDGALLMHMGSMAAIGSLSKKSFVHIVFNNGCHASVGGQPTLGFSIDFCSIAKACGYTSVYCIEDENDLKYWLQHSFIKEERQFVEIRINAVTLHKPGRPAGEPAGWKEILMENLLINKV